MKKQELINAVSEKLAGNLKRTDVEAITTALVDTIRDELAAGREFALTGFGKFEVKTRAARTGRNPSTGEELQIPEKKTVGFKPHKALLD